MSQLHDLTAHDARECLDKRDFSSVELTRAFLARIADVEPKVRSYVTVTEDLALEQAQAADERIAAGRFAL